MKVGIIVHSKTGNTFSVAEKLKERLTGDGTIVELRRIEPVGGEPAGIKDLSAITFEPSPEVTGFDRLIFAGPVRGFSMSPILGAYINKLPSLKNQKVDLFVTQSFPKPFLGGNQAISQMTAACTGKGAIIGKTGIVNNMSKKRQSMIEDVIERLSK